MINFSVKQRGHIYQNMKQEKLDVLVIGGGITGAGIALDAKTRGLNVGLLEMQDFAAGTSSRSTKLVHGGLRYLKQFEVKMVAEVGKERAIVYENAPHVTRPEWMLLPIYKDGTFGKFSTNLGLMFYDFLANVKKSERRKILSVEETLAKEPLLKPDGLKGAGLYVEYKTDDARLTIEVMKKAAELGAFALNHAKVENLIYDEGKVVGVEVMDQLNYEKHEIYAEKIVNATGPWVDHIRELDQSKKGKTLHLTKGVHLVFDQSRFPLNHAVYFDVPDGRMVFAIPRDGKTYVGTTDTSYHGSIENPKMTEEDANYIIHAVNHMFPSLMLKKGDVESNWAGLRPLIHEEGKSPSEISRKDEIFVSESGLVSIAGGKLTGYRKMAESVIDLISKDFNQTIGKSKTKQLVLSGGDVGGSDGFNQFLEEKTRHGVELGIPESLTRTLIHRFGSNIDEIFKYIDRSMEINESIIRAMVKYSIEHEMTCTPSDFLIRRTSELFFNIDSVYQNKNEVIEMMSEELRWSDDEKVRYVEELNEQLSNVKEPISQ